tara:strand:+ start:245 stop:367 length:123 start_codon:yes stop_codon:yes gene_type:complete
MDITELVVTLNSPEGGPKPIKVAKYVACLMQPEISASLKK